MPALPSFLIKASADILAGVLAAGGDRSRAFLQDRLARVPDHRSVMGRWHLLEFVLTLSRPLPARGRAGNRAGAGACSLALVAHGEERARWTIHADRVIDENPHIKLSIASVELPGGVTFDQYVIRLPRCAMTVVLDEAAGRMLLIWRHRFIIDRWVWELPGGYIDPGEDGPAAAAREVEEETGYRPRAIEHVLTFQPMTGTADSAHELYLARGADQVSAPQADETAAVRWMPLAEIPALIASGAIVGAATIIGAQHALLTAAQRVR